MNNGPFHFDVSVQDTFLPLFFGSSVLFHRDVFVGSYIINLIRRHGITHVIAVSSVLELISRDPRHIRSLAGESLSVLVTGGEVCSPKLIALWLDSIPELRVLYGYGPTECNSLCLTYEILAPEPAREAPYPIGKPFAGMDAVLLDENDAVVSDCGITAVLAIAGPQLMAGYWRDPELTARVTRRIGARNFYVTGDFCYRDANEDFVFVGRRDSEVKLRGRRISLAEIRDAFLAQPGVSYAHIDIVEVQGDQRIASFAQIAPIAAVDGHRLLASVSERLADYMVPRHLVTAASPPRTSTGKIATAEVADLLALHVRQAPDEPWIPLDTKRQRTAANLLITARQSTS